MAKNITLTTRTDAELKRLVDEHKGCGNNG